MRYNSCNVNWVWVSLSSLDANLLHLLPHLRCCNPLSLRSTSLARLRTIPIRSPGRSRRPSWSASPWDPGPTSSPSALQAHHPNVSSGPQYSVGDVSCPPHHRCNVHYALPKGISTRQPSVCHSHTDEDDTAYLIPNPPSHHLPKDQSGRKDIHLVIVPWVWGP
jgi:hypothetical protein